MVREGDIATLTRQQGFFVIGLADGQTFPAPTSRSSATAWPGGTLWEIALSDGQSIDPIVDLLRARGLSIRHLLEKRQTLEDIFMETVVSADRASMPVPRSNAKSGVPSDEIPSHPARFDPRGD